MQGVDFSKNETGAVCISIGSLSDEFKEVVRERLSEICHGAAKASRNPTLYSYRKTLVSFLQRYDTKTANTKKGMIGELLTHVLFLHFVSEFSSASPNFNMEETSIKKGFDLVLHHHETEEIWFVEVKSGDSGSNTSAQKLGSLLSTAKNGLKENLNSDRDTLWHNAVNGATTSIKSGKLKSQIEAILEGYIQSASEGQSHSTDYNAVLVAVCYSNGSPFSTDVEFAEKHKFHYDANDFKALMSVAVQKDMYQTVEDFLRQESGNG